MSEPSLAIPSRNEANRCWLQLAATLIGLTILTCTIACRDITVGGFSWSDAPLHAMDGVFLHDLVREWPSGSWRAWAEDYYLRHQCLGIAVYYPPLFAAAEALVFTILGISVFAARFTVVLFVIGAVWLIYLLGRELFGHVAGIAAAILAIITPAGVAWSRQVMLEWPSVFWIVLAVFAYVRYTKQPTWKWSILAATACAATYLTKQTAAFVVPVVLADMLLNKRWSLLRSPSFVVPMAAAVGIIAVYGKATSGMNALAPQLVSGVPPWHHLRTAEHWLWYGSRIPAILGWPVLVILLAPIVAAVRSRELRNGAVLPLLWAVAWWFISTVIAAKEERYFFFAVPALALLGGAGLVELAKCKWTRPAAIVGAGLAAFALVAALRTPTLRLTDLTPTVAFLAQQRDADLVLVDAVRDGQLIFDVRCDENARDRIIPMRASKLLYSRAARTRYDYAQHVTSPQQIVELLDRLGMRYIVLEDRLPSASQPGQPAPDEDRSWDTPPRLMLRELLTRDARFERVYSQPLRCGDPIWNYVNLVTYRYRNAPARQAETISIPVPAMGKSVELRIKR